MKKLFTLATVLLIGLALHAQTPITVVNQDFEDTTTPLALNPTTGRYAIKGFNLRKMFDYGTFDAQSSQLSTNSGVAGSQALTVVLSATTAPTAHFYQIRTDSIDISNRVFGTFTYTYKIKCDAQMTAARPFAHNMYAYDEDGVDVSNKTLTLDRTAQTAMNASSDYIVNVGVYQTLGSVYTIAANATGKNAKYIVVGIDFGKNMPSSLSSVYHFDNFELTGPATTAINSVNGSFKVQVFPNPAQDYAQINCEEGIDEVTVYSASGAKVTSFVVGATTHKMDVSSFAKGVYFISVKNSKGVANTKINKI